MTSVYFENDAILFETFYTFEEGIKGDGYLQPDDDDKIVVDCTYMVGYHTENGEKLMLPTPADVSHIINKDVIETRDLAIEKNIYQHENL